MSFTVIIISKLVSDLTRLETGVLSEVVRVFIKFLKENVYTVP